MKAPVAVIDIGSNSIKMLVAAAEDSPDGLNILHEETCEVRISQGISGNPPLLRADRIAAGLEAVASLWKICSGFSPLAGVRIVATSAVRTARNGREFTDAVASITGYPADILSGEEEADAIALGVRTDPLVASQLDNLMVFDLGGGSLELIRIEASSAGFRTSLPLGSVRLTEQFVTSPARPMPMAERNAIRQHVKNALSASRFPMCGKVVGCSGGLAALRHILAAREQVAFADCHPFFSRQWINETTDQVLSLDQAARIKLAGIPAKRADIFPAALLTIQAILEAAEADGLLHSLHNLRYGLAWMLLHPAP